MADSPPGMPPDEPADAAPRAPRFAPAGLEALFPWPPRTLRWGRAAKVLLRTVHVVAMALVLGGLAYGAPEPALAVPVVLTVASGVLLLVVDLAGSCVFLYQGAGVATLLKLALVLLGALVPSVRLPLYVAATVVASVGSHMSGRLRHYSLVHGRVLFRDEVPPGPGPAQNRPVRRTTEALVLLLAALALPALPAFAQPALVLATTTSTQDSGLLDDLLPRFTAETGIRVKTIAVGSGEALAMGRRGDADVLLVHSPAAEEEFMAQGFGALRLDVMHNDFVLVGPPSDPAGVKGLPAPDALRRIAERGALFASRDDRSGTHARELDLWKKAGVSPSGKAWYVATGQGMGETARVASEKGAYTLADRGTYLALKRTLDLVVLVEGGGELRNPYRVIVVSPAKDRAVHEEEARRFARWIVSPAVQKAIGEFGRKAFGQPLFVPDAK